MFAPATKKLAKLRAALFGPSGAGKTFTALRIATGLGGRIAFIDTERRSASKYSDRFKFDVCELAAHTIEAYIKAIDHAAGQGYAVLIIDSLTHGWHQLLEEVEKLAQAKFKGNTWSAWSEGTPRQRALVDALLNFPGHIIATMRSKTEWQTTSDDRGRCKPVRVGLSPEQGKGIEYEFDLLLELSTEHIATIIKDRTGKFQDQLIDKPGEDFGKALRDWLESPDAPLGWVPDKVAEQTAKYGPRQEPVAGQLDPYMTLITLANELNIPAETQKKWCETFKVDDLKKLNDEQCAKIIAKLEAKKKTAA